MLSSRKVYKTKFNIKESPKKIQPAIIQKINCNLRFQSKQFYEIDF